MKGTLILCVKEYCLNFYTPISCSTLTYKWENGGGPSNPPRQSTAPWLLQEFTQTFVWQAYLVCTEIWISGFMIFFLTNMKWTLVYSNFNWVSPLNCSTFSSNHLSAFSFPLAQHWNIYHSCLFPLAPHISHSTLPVLTAPIPWGGHPSPDYLFWLVLLSLVLLSDCEALPSSAFPLSKVHED